MMPRTDLERARGFLLDAGERARTGDLSAAKLRFRACVETARRGFEEATKLQSELAGLAAAAADDLAALERLGARLSPEDRLAIAGAWLAISGLVPAWEAHAHRASARRMTAKAREDAA